MQVLGKEPNHGKEEIKPEGTILYFPLREEGRPRYPNSKGDPLRVHGGERAQVSASLFALVVSVALDGKKEKNKRRYSAWPPHRTDA